jgi:hypothetical protein
MAIPVIDTRVGILSVEEGGNLTHQFAATGTPTSWSASGLPQTLSINSAGLLTGAVNYETSGVYQVTISATNADGTGTLAILISVFQKPVLFQDQLTIGIDMDVVTGKITVIGIPEGYGWGPPVSNKRDDGYMPVALGVHSGDRFPVSIGFRRPDGTYQSYTIRSIKGVVKEFATDPAYNFLEGDVTPTGGGTLMPRYLTTLSINQQVWDAIISNYEQEYDAYVDMQASIEVSLLDDNSEFSSSQSVTQASMGENQVYAKTIPITGFPKMADEVTVNLASQLVVAGLASNTRNLNNTVSVSWDGSSYAVSDLSGTLVDSGTEEESHWNAGLTLSGVTANANGIDLAYSIETTDTTYENVVEFVQDNSWPYQLTVVNGMVGTIDEAGSGGGGGGDLTVYLTVQAVSGAYPLGMAVTMSISVPPIETSTLTLMDFWNGLWGGASPLLPQYPSGSAASGDYPSLTVSLFFNDMDLLDDDGLPETDPILPGVFSFQFTTDGWNGDPFSINFQQVDLQNLSDVVKNGTVTATVTGTFENVFRKTSSTFLLRGEKEAIPNT